MDSIQAAVLNVKLSKLPEWTSQRVANARRYGELFQAAGLQRQIVLPEIDQRCQHTWNQYTVRIPGGNRDAVKAQLAAPCVGRENYYPIPPPSPQCFQYLR